MSSSHICRMLYSYVFHSGFGYSNHVSIQASMPLGKRLCTRRTTSGATPQEYVGFTNYKKSLIKQFHSHIIVHYHPFNQLAEVTGSWRKANQLNWRRKKANWRFHDAIGRGGRRKSTNFAQGSNFGCWYPFLKSPLCARERAPLQRHVKFKDPLLFWFNELTKKKLTSILTKEWVSSYMTKSRVQAYASCPSLVSAIRSVLSSPSASYRNETTCIKKYAFKWPLRLPVQEQCRAYTRQGLIMAAPYPFVFSHIARNERYPNAPWFHQNPLA